MQIIYFDEYHINLTISHSAYLKGETLKTLTSPHEAAGYIGPLELLVALTSSPNKHVCPRVSDQRRWNALNTDNRPQTDSRRHHSCLFQFALACQSQDSINQSAPRPTHLIPIRSLVSHIVSVRSRQLGARECLTS